MPFPAFSTGIGIHGSGKSIDVTESDRNAGSRPRLGDVHALKTQLANAGRDVKLIVDAWCKTLEDVKLFADSGANAMRRTLALIGSQTH